MSCSSYANEGSCSAWAPANAITFTSSGYEVGSSWLSGVLADPAPTWTCDDAYLDDLPEGKFEVKSASSGEALYELGLRNGDVLHTINGIRLDNTDDAYQAFYQLYVLGDKTNYDLYVARGSSYIHLYYEIVN